MIASENQKSQYDLRRSDSMSPITYIIIIERIGERGAESVGEGVVIEKRRPDDRCGRRHASGPRRATGVCIVVPNERSEEVSRRPNGGLSRSCRSLTLRSAATKGPCGVPPLNRRPSPPARCGKYSRACRPGEETRRRNLALRRGITGYLLTLLRSEKLRVASKAHESENIIP